MIRDLSAADMLVSFLDNSGNEELNFRRTEHLAGKRGVQPAECPQILWHCSRMSLGGWEDSQMENTLQSFPTAGYNCCCFFTPFFMMRTHSQLFFPATVAEFKQFYNQSEPFSCQKKLTNALACAHKFCFVRVA